MEESVFSSSTATNSDENEDENWSDINTDEADDDNGLSYFDKWILHMMYDNRYFQIAR